MCKKMSECLVWVVWKGNRKQAASLSTKGCDGLYLDCHLCHTRSQRQRGAEEWDVSKLGKGKGQY